MKPIRIDASLVEFAKSFYNVIFHNRKHDFQSPLDRLNVLIGQKTGREQSFLRALRLNLSDIQMYNPSQQEVLINQIEQKVGRDLFYRNNEATAFSNEIVTALRYDHLQKYGAVKIADRLEIKVCPYCNAMLAITIQKTNKKKKARFQLDHYYPKSKHPYLSTCFFNLIPSCGNCNQAKSKRDVILGKDFHLYANETPLNAFKFQLDNADKIKKILGVKKDQVKIEFTYQDERDKVYVEHHNESFDIQGIYDTQKDVVEELIWKSQAYGDSKISELANTLKLPEVSIRRMIIGNYSEYDDIHKRPLAKFMQDMAKQLEII